MRIISGLICLLLLVPLSADAQVKERALKPISFKIIHIEPTTVITYEPFRVTYRLEYLKPQDGKEVRILVNLDKDHFQKSFATPVDLDFEAAKKELIPKIGQAKFDSLKLDSGPRLIVSDFQAGDEEIVGDKIRRNFIVTLRLIREKTTFIPFSIIRLEADDVSVSWAVAKLGQKEGEYDNEDPIKSGKFRFNHALTIPTHDPNLNFRSRVAVSKYSSYFWFFWGIPVIALSLAGVAAWRLAKLFKEPVYTVEEKAVSIAGGVAKTGEVTGIKRMKFEYARRKLWKAAVMADTNKDSRKRNSLIGELYGSLNDLLLSALPNEPMGSLPVDFMKVLTPKNKRWSRNSVLHSLAVLANDLKPVYESISDGIEEKNKDTNQNNFSIDSLVRKISIETRKLWWYNRFFDFLANKVTNKNPREG